MCVTNASLRSIARASELAIDPRLSSTSVATLRRGLGQHFPPKLAVPGRHVELRGLRGGGRQPRARRQPGRGARAGGGRAAAAGVQHARAVPGLGDHQPAARRHQQPALPRAHAGRLLRRRGTPTLYTGGTVNTIHYHKQNTLLLSNARVRIRETCLRFLQYTSTHTLHSFNILAHKQHTHSRSHTAIRGGS